MPREFKEKTVLIIGLGESGFSAAKLLNKMGARIRVLDSFESDNIAQKKESLGKLGISEIETGGHSHNILEGCELVVISPGVKADNPLIAEARKRSLAVISEVELAYQCAQGRVIAVTGTNGKTTTASLIHEVLKAAGKKSYLCGNIGLPFSEIAAKTTKDTYIVLEVSSFQLSYIESFRPYIGMILNIDMDHLDYHPDMSDYISSKARIFENQTSADWLILRRCDYTDIFAEYNIQSKLIKISCSQAADIYFDKKEKTAAGSFSGSDIRPIPMESFNLKALKAIDNFLFALAVSKIAGIDREVFLNSVAGFCGLEHRLEEIGIIKGRRIINDSKSTNVLSGRLAVLSVEEPIILIAGGEDKNTDYSRVDINFLGRAEKIILYGKSRDRMKKAFKDYTEIVLADDLESAVRAAWSQSAEGDCILFSPMAASFDMFDNYKHRGRVFKALVKEITDV